MAAKILVIDDEESIRMLLEDLLTGQGMEVITAENGVEGVRRTFNDVPEVVLTDILMPDMDGITFIQRVRNKIPARKLPIIVVSALGMEKNVVQAFKAGATDYLVKPFRHSELLARVQVALGQRVDPKNVEYVGREGTGEREIPIRSGSVLDMGKYRILSEIGAGGMGTIYHAVHAGYGIEVALKVLNAEMGKDRNNIMRFLREVRIATQMSHPHIVDVYDVGFSGEWYYYAMEMLPSTSLQSRVREDGWLEETDVLGVGGQLASALVHMHEAGFMHRDVKPDNVIFESTGSVKLIDFGLACAADDARLTREGSFIGTPGFVAPENIEAYQPPDPTSDVYSLGATLFFAATGRSPFQGKGGATAKLTAQVTERPPAPRALNPVVSEAFSDLILRMMEPDPAKRVFPMARVRDELSDLPRARATEDP